VTRPVVTHPTYNLKCKQPHMVAQGFHPNPSDLTAYLVPPGNQAARPLNTTLPNFWCFDLGPLQNNRDYILHVVDTTNGDDSPVPFRIKAGYGPQIYYPASDGDIVSQTFAAWGTSGPDLTNAGQTMVCTGGPALGFPGTTGQIIQQPSAPNSGGIWVVQFSVGDLPDSNNLYQLTINNGQPSHRNNLEVIANPP
jgi:hypothetical protein